MKQYRRKKEIFLMITVIGLSFLFGYWLNGDDSEPRISADPLPAALSPEPASQDAMYVCPMMCIPQRKVDGKCPVCGMDLVPTYDEVGKESGTPKLKLTPEAAKRAGVETARVERKFVSAEVRLFGRIDYDLAHMSYVTAYTPGVIDRTYVKRAGAFVRWGDPLFDFYSSDLRTTQQQLVDAIKYVPSFLAFQKNTPHVAREMPVLSLKRAEDPDRRSAEKETALKTIEAIRRKLRILGMPKRDIDEMMKLGEATGIATVYSPMYGQVIEQNAYEGSYVNTGTPIFTLGDPKYVWAKLDAYETDYPWIRREQAVTLQTDAYPGETFKGKIVYIDPVFNRKTRTFNIGVIFPDRGGRLKAGMLARAVIHARLTADGKIAGTETDIRKAPLVIPASAPLITGKRAVVYVATAGDGADLFEGREITLGPKAGDYYLVVGGLNEGERVVVNGSFKIDSALQILAEPSMMDIPGGHSATGHHGHGGSQAMDDTYQSDRMKSRRERISEPHRADSHMSTGRGDGGSSLRNRLSRRRSTVSRRQPGAYGDTTRRKSLPQNR